MDSENIFARRVKELRLMNKMTQPQLGEAIGLSKQAINDIEQGRRETTITKAILMARLFNTTVHYLVGDTDNPSRPSEIPFVEILFEDKLIHERLKSLRLQKGTTQKEIAEKIGVSPVSVQRFEYGTVRPSLEKLIALADFFGVSLDYLVGRSDDPTRH